MGVTYKLRQDVVDFIVQTKRNNSALSCRKLVGVVKERFAVDISKSSVNGVIKEFNLSGPIGRHSAKKAPKNFSIPQAKKEILLKNVQPFLATAKEELHEIVIAPEIIVPVESGVLEREETMLAIPLGPQLDSAKGTELIQESSNSQIVDNKDIVDEKADDCSLLLRPDPIKESQIQVSGAVSQDIFAEVCSGIAQAQAEKELPVAKASVWAGDQGELYGRLGASVMWFVFKAACSSSRLGEALARILEPLPDGVTPQQCEALFFASFFAEHLPGHETDDLHTLWKLSGLEDGDGRVLMERLINHDNDRILCIGIRTGLAMAFTPVRYLRLLTKKGARFYVDAASFELHHEFIDAGQAAAVLPIFIAVERAVDRLITNIAPFVADVPGVGMTPELLNFIRLMDGYGEDVLSAVELIGDEDVKCVEFSAVPLIRRGFILRVRLTSRESAQIDYSMLANKKLFFDELANRAGSYFEGAYQLEGVNRPLRVFSVKLEEGSEFVLLTNIFGAGVKADDILKQFLLSESANFMGIDHINTANNTKIAPQVTSLSAVYREIDILIQKFIFLTGSPLQSWDEMCQVLYNLPGHIRENPKALFIRFQVPANFTYQAGLSVFLRKLNNAALRAPDGRRIVFSF